MFFALVAGNAASGGQAATADLQTAFVEAGVPAYDADLLSEQFAACFTDRAGQDDPAILPASCEIWESSYGALPAEQLRAVGPTIDAAADQALAATFSQALSHTLWYHLAALLAAAGVALLLPR